MSSSELVKKGRLLLIEGRFDEALSFIEQALLVNTNSAEIWNLKGAALRSLGRYDEAIECFNKALELDPTDKAAS